MAALALVVGITAGGLSGFQSDEKASASGDSVALYISAPFVRGSHLTGNTVLTESFNSLTTCASSTAIGTWSITSGAGTCEIAIQPSTAAPDGIPAVGGQLSNFVWGKTGFDSTFTFASPVKYVGLWWMMGSANNTVQFLDSSNNVLATLNSADIINFFGPNSSVSNSDTRTVNRVDGLTHPTRHYYRSPANYGGTVESPTMNYNVDTHANEPWVYLNLFIAGNLSVSKLRIAGTNFEVDNITISTAEAGPTGNMVLVKNVLGTPPAAQTITWSPTNTTNDISTGSVTPSSLATSSGTGAISYSVVNAGASGCSVNSSTGVITATGAGTCIVRATAAAVGVQFFTATKDVTFTFTANVPSTPGAPTAVAGDGSATVTITPAGSGPTPSSYNVAASPGGATCTVSSPATSCEVTGLTNGTSYTFTASATNGAGTSAASAASNTVTPTRAAAPVAPPYTGPIAMHFDVSCVPAGSAMTVTLTGERLNTIKSASVNGTNIPVSAATTTSLKLSLPVMTAGTYDITYVSDSGVLTHQASLRVCVTSAAKPGEFQVTKRFSGYRGDRGPVVASDRRAIASFLKAHPGLTEITCIGSTSGVPAKSTDPALATARATNACKIVKELAPSISTKISTSTGKGVGQFYRAVTLTGKGVRN